MLSEVRRGGRSRRIRIVFRYVRLSVMGPECSSQHDVILNDAQRSEGSAFVLCITADSILGSYDGGMHGGWYCTYIMASRSRTLYIGVTGNLHQRVFQHKWKECDGFTARYNCDRLVWFEKFQYIQKAIAREKELKGWRRAKKIALIESTNPGWMDLSRDWYDCEPADYRRALDRMNA
jgi:putative endonuclease